MHGPGDDGSSQQQLVQQQVQQPQIVTTDTELEHGRTAYLPSSQGMLSNTSVPQRVLFDLSLPTRATRTHSDDGLACAVGDRGEVTYELIEGPVVHGRSELRPPGGTAVGRKSEGHQTVFLPVHPSLLGRTLSRAIAPDLAGLGSSAGEAQRRVSKMHPQNQAGSQRDGGAVQRRASDPFHSPSVFSATPSSLRVSAVPSSGGMETEGGLAAAAAVAEKPVPKAQESTAPVDPETGKQVRATGIPQ